MAKLEHYLDDGADAQSRAVLAFLQEASSLVEESWNPQWDRYDAEPEVARWSNCREQGYVVSLYHSGNSRQLNIAFFEHRNSDAICAVKWEQWFGNAPTIETADFGDDVYKDKWDVSHKVGHGEVVAMAKWIREQFEAFWKECGAEKNSEN